MKRIGLLAAVFAFAAVASAAPVEKILVVPLKKGIKGDPNLSIANYLAQELDTEGKLSPIVWSTSDPAFRDAATSGLLRDEPDYPTPRQAQEAAGRLGARYVFTYTTDAKSGRIQARGELFLGVKSIWKDTQNLSSVHGLGSGDDDSAASIAHTWMLLLDSSALKQLVAHPKSSTPSLTQGSEPQPAKQVDVAPTVHDATGVAELVSRYERNGQYDAALNLVRDSVDANPLDPNLRLILVKLYERRRDYRGAAEAAAAGSQVAPQNVELRLACLRDLLASGQGAQAKEQLNEIVARHANDPQTLMLEGQTYLALGDPATASVALDKAVQAAPTPEAYFWRATARALLGGADGVTADLAKYAQKPMSPSEETASYPIAVRILADATDKDLKDATALYQQAGASPLSPAVATKLDQLNRSATARSNFLQGITPPQNYKTSHLQRLLAQKLLLESLLDVQDYLKSQSDDSMTDARINLGEAMKQSKAGNDTFASEGNDGTSPTSSS